MAIDITGSSFSPPTANIASRPAMSHQPVPEVGISTPVPLVVTGEEVVLVLQATNTGWWFQTFLLFSIIYIYIYNYIYIYIYGNVIIPTDELHHFSRWFFQPP